MEKAILMRQRRSDHGTEGILHYKGKSCFSLELPWKNNIIQKSCIPQGTYLTQIRMSPKFGRIYWVMSVEGRTYILIHAGNLAGDVDLGLKTHTYGCILLGKRRGTYKRQRAILLSRFALTDFMMAMANELFSLTIIDPFVEA